MSKKHFFQKHKKAIAIAIVAVAAVAAVLFWRTETGVQQNTKKTSQKTVKLDGFQKLKASYSGKIYEGDLFDASHVSVKAISDDGKTQDVTNFDWDGAESVGGKTSYIIFTSYGETSLTVTPVAIRSCVAADGNYYAGSDFSGTIDLTYTDGTVKEIKSSEVEFPNGSTLTEGENQIAFTYRGCSHTLYVNAMAGGRISNAKTQYKDELDHSVYNSVTDRLFMTVTKETGANGGNYYLTHIILSDPSQLKIGTANNMIGSYVTLSQEASSVGWTLGMTAGTSSENSNFGYGKNAAGSVQGCIIRGSKTVVSGTTTGNEVCLTSGGALFSPPAGISADQLLAQGVTDTVESVMPLLIQNGTDYEEGSTDYGSSLPACAVGMVSPGEYYFLTSDTSGMGCREMQSILAGRGCTFARAMGSGTSVGLYYRTTPILESTEATQDFIYVTGES